MSIKIGFEYLQSALQVAVAIRVNVNCRNLLQQDVFNWSFAEQCQCARSIYCMVCETIGLVAAKGVAWVSAASFNQDRCSCVLQFLQQGRRSVVQPLVRCYYSSKLVLILIWTGGSSY